MIDLDRPIRFYDDRGKTKEYMYCKEVVYSDDTCCLCRINPDFFGDGCKPESILFDIKTGAVYNSTYFSWYAQNYESAEEILSSYKWIKVSKYKDDPSKTWEERFNNLNKHHIEETEFLINKVRELVSRKQE